MSTADVTARLPASVTVSFPRQIGGRLTGDQYALTVTLASLSLAESDGKPGHPGSHYHRSALAAVGTGTPDNAAALLALARQWAADWYRWQLAWVDRDYDGVVAWLPDGLHDVTWRCRPGDCGTRVRPAGLEAQSLRPEPYSQHGFWARLTAVATSSPLWRYSFVEVEFEADVAHATEKAGGLSGDWASDPAYEVGGNSTLPADPEDGAVVWMRHNGLHYYFSEVEETFPVRLSGRSGTAYSWVEQLRRTGGTYSDRSNGRSESLTAYELNQREDVPYGPAGVGAIVWLKMQLTHTEGVREWGFQYETGGAGAGGVTIINVDITNTSLTINEYVTNLFVGGTTNISYFIRNGNTVQQFYWLCFDDTCGWFDVCACEWFPGGSGSGSGSAAGMPWWCVPVTGGGSGGGGGGGAGFDGCQVCPGGSSAWGLTVPATGSFAGSPWGDLAGSHTLTWLSVASNGNPDCWWSTASGTSGGDPRWDLLYTGGAWWLQGKSASGNVVTYRLSGDWACCGDNTLTFLGGSTGFAGPTTLTVEPLGDCDDEGGGGGSGSGSGSVTGYRCVQSETMPVGALNSVGYDTREDCEAGCGGSGSGGSGGSGGGGGGGEIYTGCYPDALPTTLYLHFSGGTGDCACLNGEVIPVTYVSGGITQFWRNPAAALCGGSATDIQLDCDGEGDWTVSGVYLGVGDCGFAATAESEPGSPFEIHFVGVAVAECCSGTVNITVLETP